MQETDFVNMELNEVVIKKISPILPQRSDLHLYMLRLDALHPIVSGNKLFKLKYYLEEALQSTHRTLLTFGGAYSNHLAATAYAAREAGLRSIACVRGEEGRKPSHTLDFCRSQQMEIHFMERELYRQISETPHEDFLTSRFGPHITIPSGGFGVMGARGARDIADFIPENSFSHICVAVGTATTLAGLLMAGRKEKIIAFPALKGMTDIPERLRKLTVQNTIQPEVMQDYSFGGFGKWNMDLISYMNRFYKVNNIPLDFVYNAKMMFGITDLIRKGFFPPGSHILAIHTGGLQGNDSLPANLLAF